VAPVQRRAWTADWPPAEVEMLLAGTDLADMVEAWHAGIVRPPDARCRVLVALEGEQVVGFAAMGPSDDDDAGPHDAMVTEFAVDPPSRRRGHGSRLMNAVVDTMRADGFRSASWWVRSVDDAMLAFLRSAGWAPDGAAQEFRSEDGRLAVRQVRMRTMIE